MDHVCLCVTDVPESIRWYRRVLGLRLEHTSEPHFWPADPASPAFLCGGGAGDPVKVALLPLADPSKRIRDHHGAHMAFGVSKDEWERARDELPALLREALPESGGGGAVGSTAVEEADYGLQWSLFFSDPDNNILEVTTWEVD
jgi:catechol 2,3-dioxygenase-like lactoylglutathione lyase family enzyme